MDFKNYLKISDEAYKKVQKNKEDYKVYNDYEKAMPKIVINTPNRNKFTTPELISSPEIMLKNNLDTVQNHLDIGDDYIPQARIEFGTGQFAHAFGCEMYIPENSPVCNKSHILYELEDIENLELPDINAGWMAKVYEFTKFYTENKPEIVEMQLPDYQGPFNNAQLLRGTDILFDFYDSPEHVHILLDKMTDYQIQISKYYRELAGMEEGYFADWGMYWKGGARICNCSLHLLSTEFYRDFIKQYDEKFLDAMGGGRIHYCGTHDNGLIDMLANVKNNNGLDLDSQFHNIWETCGKLPKETVVTMPASEADITRILSGDFPNKRNIVLSMNADNIEDGKYLYQNIKKVIEKKFK